MEPLAEVERTPAQALDLAQQLLDADRPFYAHDVLEEAWKAAGRAGAGDVERELWQGLAQVCVGLTHVQRGNPTGAARLLRRGAGRLQAAAADAAASATAAAHGVGPVDVAAQALRLADDVEAGRAVDGALRLRG